VLCGADVVDGLVRAAHLTSPSTRISMRGEAIGGVVGGVWGGRVGQVLGLWTGFSECLWGREAALLLAVLGCMSPPRSREGMGGFVWDGKRQFSGRSLGACHHRLEERGWGVLRR